MTTVAHNRRSASVLSASLRRAGPDLAAGLLPLLLLSWPAWRLFALGVDYLAHNIDAYGALALLIVWTGLISG